MPSVSADSYQSAATAAVAPPHEYLNRPSFEKSSASPTIAAWAYGRSLDENVKLDGVIKDGKNTSLHSLHNGNSTGTSYGRDRAHSRAGSSLSVSNGNAGAMAVERERKNTNYCDDYAKLEITNGYGQVDGTALQRMAQKRLPDVNQSVNGDHPPQPPVDDASLNVNETASSPDSVDKRCTNQNNDNSNETGQSRSFGHISAPVASLTPSPGAASSSSSVAPFSPTNRIVHRHTLQVPRSAGPRSSREFINSPDDSTGRLSPQTQGSRRASMSLMRRTTRSIHSDLHLDEVPQDEDAARWTETIRAKRASRRRRREEEDDDRVVVGTKVDQNHVNWVTAYNMLTGIRFTVSRTNAKLDRELTDADFEAKHKFSFDITGNELTPSAKYDFKFKDYAPWVFRHLRAKFQLDPADYLMSLTSKYILSELGSPGKSGSFFYFSRDYKYIIKTIHHGEHKLLRSILKDYYHHVEENPNTLVSQFYGLHRVKIAYGRKIHFVVMNNLFPPHRDIHQMFDLKGSTIGRDFKEDDLGNNPRVTLKDLNWLRRDYHLELGPEKKKAFIEQLERDVALLQRLKIMDYSLLIGIHDLTKGNEENLRDKTLKVFQPGGDKGDEPQPNVLTRTPSKLENARKARELRQIIKQEKPVPMGQSTSKMPDELLGERKNQYFYSDDGGFQATHEDGHPSEKIYYLGVIDCLTHYGTVKKAEHFWKGLSHDSKQISPIPPESYGERFIKFINEITKTVEEADREKEIAEAMGSSMDTTRRRRRTFSTDKATDKPGEMHGSEEKVPNRSIIPVRSPSTELSGGIAGSTLPVVEEVGEAASTGGRSGRSRESTNENMPTSPHKHLDARTMGLNEGNHNTPSPFQQSEDKQLPPVPNMPLGKPLDSVSGGNNIWQRGNGRY